MALQPTTDPTETLVQVGPLISQIPGPDDGFPTAAAAEHWRPRGCGIACVRMILDAHRIGGGSYWSLVREGLDHGAYCDRGWIHQGLVDMLARPGGHLVLVTGVRGPRAGPSRFRVHHPSATRANNWADHWVDLDAMAASFSGNYMAFDSPS